MNKLPLGALHFRAPKVQEKRIAVRERIGQSLHGRPPPASAWLCMYVCRYHWRRKRGGGGGMCPPTFERGGGKDMFVPPHFQAQNLGLGIEPTDICDVTLAWLASRCWARQMCPPPHILSRSYAVVYVGLCCK